MRAVLILLFLLNITVLTCCESYSSSNALHTNTGHAAKDVDSGENQETRILLDFEKANPPVEWTEDKDDLTVTSAATTTESPEKGTESVMLTRSSLRPQEGLWSLQIHGAEKGGGAVVHKFDKSIDLNNFDTVYAGVLHTGMPAQSGRMMAAVYLVDGAGHRVAGDWYAITTRWQQVPMDLKTAAEAGLQLGQITELGVRIRTAIGLKSPVSTTRPATADGKKEIDLDTKSTRNAPDLTPISPDLKSFSSDIEAKESGILPFSMDIQTDNWAVSRDKHSYLGDMAGSPKSFYVKREGGRLLVGSVNQYEIAFYERAGTERPWISVTQGGGASGRKRLVLGQPGTGLMLLDQEGYDGLAGGMQQGAYVRGLAAEGKVKMPAFSWPTVGAAGAEQTTWEWECGWTSPVGALVEVKQTVGPFDAMGRPAKVVTWRFMIYQWGQVFVHAEWPTGNSELGIVNSESAGGVGGAGATKSESTPPTAALRVPVSWALVLDSGVVGEERYAGMTGAGENAEKLLAGIYPRAVREAVGVNSELGMVNSEKRLGALPHQMQLGSPIGMIAKTGLGVGFEKGLWWWAEGDGRKVFGAGISAREGAEGRSGPVDCMLLVNEANALAMAGSFGQYLVPPRVKVRQGELDRNFPGDVDNDGFVDSYGFEVVRLSRGRASFVVDPRMSGQLSVVGGQKEEGVRPLFYPVILFTVPAVEREDVDLKHSRVLVNVDGKQFEDPPQWPDGSFLLQLPWVIDRPVGVEAILVKK